MTNARVHDKAEIERLLALGLSPITDNVEALLELGFERSYPQIKSGYEATIYERSIDRGARETANGLRRMMARERAFFEAPPARRLNARPVAVELPDRSAA